MKASRPTTMDDLIARAEISDAVLAYATGIDRRDWALYRSIFVDTVDFDFSSWSGSPGTTLAADDWVDGVRGALSGFDATHHVSSNHVITLNGDRAICVSYMVAYHLLATSMGENIFTLGGYYTNELARTADGWKIAKCKLSVTWATGNRHLFELARAKWQTQ